MPPQKCPQPWAAADIDLTVGPTRFE